MDDFFKIGTPYKTYQSRLNEITNNNTLSNKILYSQR